MSILDEVSLKNLIKQARTLNDERLELDRQAKLLKVQVESLSISIITKMEAEDLQECDGARIEIVEKPYISDFSSLEEYVIKNKATDLFQKRLTETAVKLRWEEGIQIPGVGLSSESKLRL